MPEAETQASAEKKEVWPLVLSDKIIRSGEFKKLIKVGGEGRENRVTR